MIRTVNINYLKHTVQIPTKFNVMFKFKVPISLIFLSFRWKVEPFSNTKFQKLNSFSRFPFFSVFEFGNVQIGQFWDSCRFWPSTHSIMKAWCDYVEEGTCAASGWISTLSIQQFLRLRFKKQRKTEKFSFKYFVCRVFSCKTLITAKDVLLLLRHRYQSPVALSKLKFVTFFDKKTYLDAEIFFGFSISEFMNDNTFSLKDKKSDIGILIVTNTTPGPYICGGLYMEGVFRFKC